MRKDHHFRPETMGSVWREAKADAEATALGRRRVAARLVAALAAEKDARNVLNGMELG